MPTKQLIMGSPSTNALTSGVWYMVMGQGGWSGAGYNPIEVVPTACTFSNLSLQALTAPGGATSRTLTLYKNGSATALVATLSGANTSVTDTTHSVSCSAGDLVGYYITKSGSPAASTGSWCITMTPSVDGENVYMGNTVGYAPAAGKYVSPMIALQAGGALESQAEMCFHVLVL
jgi:hypothetical protein